MSLRTGMFVLMLAMMPAAGCSQRHILRMSNPEQSTTVTLFDTGPSGGDDDDTAIVLDEPKRIALVAAFIDARGEKWHPMEDESPPKPRASIVFHKGDKPTNRFLLDRDRMCFQRSTGEYWACDLSVSEYAELQNLFRVATNSKS